MSYIKGMTDIPSIHAHCNEVGDCLEWTGGVLKPSKPVGYINGERVMLRRFVWQLSHPGVSLGDARVVRMTCQNDLCLNPAHMLAITRTRSIELNKDKVFNNARVRNITKTARAKFALLDADKAREIRESNDGLEVLAARHGVSVCLIREVQAHRRWKEETLPGNFFAGLFTASKGSAHA